MSKDDINQTTRALVNRKLATATKGRYSKLLSDDVSSGCINQTVCIERVCLAIEREEPREFDRELRGLGHVHYLVPGLESLSINISNQMRRSGQNYIKTSLSEGSLERLPETIGKLYDERSDSNGLTGEWIITAKHQEKLYYLCLAKHGDSNIRERILSSCTTEFPFLCETLTLE